MNEFLIQNHLIIKGVHVISVVISGLFFVLRGYWSLRGYPIMQKRWVRISPHVVDTILLISALVLVVQIHQYPFVDAWLTAKVIALMIYIVLGHVAIRGRYSIGFRVTSWLAAIMCYAYIIGVAKERTPIFIWNI